MNDTISIQDVLDAICKSGCGSGYCGISCDDVKAIEQLPSAQQWIPCSEGPPKYDDWKIVTILDESGDTPSKYTDFGWYLEAASCWIVESEQRTDVIAWMELPEPWEGADDE